MLVGRLAGSSTRGAPLELYCFLFYQRETASDRVVDKPGHVDFASSPFKIHPKIQKYGIESSGRGAAGIGVTK